MTTCASTGCGLVKSDEGDEGDLGTLGPVVVWADRLRVPQVRYPGTGKIGMAVSHTDLPQMRHADDAAAVIIS